MGAAVYQNMTENGSDFLGHCYFYRPFFCSARSENIMVSSKKIIVGLTLTSNIQDFSDMGKCSKQLGLYQVRKMLNLAGTLVDINPTKNHCISDQSDFLNASEILQNQLTNNDMVRVLDYHVSEEYADKVYKSCADVVNPSTSGSVMDLLCGPWGGALCSPQRLLDYLGSISNGYAPFQINYFLHGNNSGTEFKPHNPPVIQCDKEAMPGTKYSLLQIASKT